MRLFSRPYWTCLHFLELLMSLPILLNRAGLRSRGIPLSNSTLLRLEKTGQFPSRVRIGNSVFWRIQDIEQYVDRLAAVQEAAR